MAVGSRQELKQYCLRKLGHPVIHINVDDAQLEDRLDDALQFFATYHFDGLLKFYLTKQVTPIDIERRYIDLTEPTPAYPEHGIEAKEALDPSGRAVASVVRIFRLYDTFGGLGMFDARYQIALNDLYGLRTNTYSDSLISYDITRRHMSLLTDMLTPDKNLRYTKSMSKLYIDMDWKQNVLPGEWLAFEAWKIIDPEEYNNVYDDMMLKRYATALIKEQWGTNLQLFNNIELPGGVALNGTEIKSQAAQEIAQIEEEIQSRWEEPPGFMIG